MKTFVNDAQGEKKHTFLKAVLFFFFLMGFCFVFAWDISCELAMSWK